MQIVIAPDKFRGTLSAQQAATAIALGISEIVPEAELTLQPVADGGEGTLDILMQASGGSIIERQVVGPLGQPVLSRFGLFENEGGKRTGVIEMALASGLSLVPSTQRNPLKATSHGTGQLIRHALDLGCHKIIVGLGGSATVDGGIGCAQALGVRFLTRKGTEVQQGGQGLSDIYVMDLAQLDPRIDHVEIIVACDVDIPLLGSRGAARAFGVQKGASADEIVRLEEGLARLAALIEERFGIDISDLPYGGASGGLGAALHVFCNGKLRPGVDVVLEETGLERHIQWADLVITGEGQLDHTTLHGKALFGVARLAKKHARPIVGIVGTLEPGFDYHDVGVDGIVVVARYPYEWTVVKEGSFDLLLERARELVDLLRIGAALRWIPHCG